MEIWLVSLATLVSLSLISALALATVWLLKTLRSLQSDLAGTNERLVGVLDKTLVLLSTKDPLAFQAVQAMSNQHQAPYADYDGPADEEMTEVTLDGIGLGAQF